MTATVVNFNSVYSCPSPARSTRVYNNPKKTINRVTSVLPRKVQYNWNIFVQLRIYLLGVTKASPLIMSWNMSPVFQISSSVPRCSRRFQCTDKKLIIRSNFVPVRFLSKTRRAHFLSVWKQIENLLLFIPGIRDTLDIVTYNNYSKACWLRGYK